MDLGKDRLERVDDLLLVLGRKIFAAADLRHAHQQGGLVRVLLGIEDVDCVRRDVLLRSLRARIALIHETGPFIRLVSRSIAGRYRVRARRRNGRRRDTALNRVFDF